MSTSHGGRGERPQDRLRTPLTRREGLEAVHPSPTLPGSLLGAGPTCTGHQDLAPGKHTQERAPPAHMRRHAKPVPLTNKLPRGLRCGSEGVRAELRDGLAGSSLPTWRRPQGPGR